MSDWIGLGIFVLALAGGLLGLSHLGRRPRPVSPEEYERRVAVARGVTRAGAAAGLHALQKLMNPRAAEAVEIVRDLRAGYYDDQQEVGDDGDGDEGAVEHDGYRRGD